MKPIIYDEITRGTSVIIPVSIKKPDGEPFSLVDTQIHFTLKDKRWNYDYEDDRAFIAKEITLTDEQKASGEFEIKLSSADTWLPPGIYYFDIVIVKGGDVARVCYGEMDIIGAPNNRVANSQIGEGILQGSTINLVPQGNTPIYLTAPLLDHLPVTMVERMTSDPPYVLEQTTARELKLRAYGPRLSFAAQARVNFDGDEHIIAFDNFHKAELPNECPLKGMTITIRNSMVKISPARPMTVWYCDNTASLFNVQTSDDPIHLKEDSVGNIHIRLTDGNDTIDLIGSYQMPNDVAPTYLYFLFTVNWYNWVDIGTYTPLTHMTNPTYNAGPLFYPSVGQNIWPPEIHYGQNWEFYPIRTTD